MILLIEDDAITRTALADHLRGAGHEVLEATTGERALLLLKDTCLIHLVIADLVLPDIDGLEFMEHVRAALSPNIPLILISGYLSDASAEAILTKFSAGAKYLPKPVRPTVLELTVQTLLTCTASVRL